MQDSKGNWREVGSVAGGVAMDKQGRQIGRVDEMPILGFGERVTITNEKGVRVTGIIFGFKGSQVIVKTDPSTRPIVT